MADLVLTRGEIVRDCAQFDRVLSDARAAAAALVEALAGEPLDDVDEIEDLCVAVLRVVAARRVIIETAAAGVGGRA